MPCLKSQSKEGLKLSAVRVSAAPPAPAAEECCYKIDRGKGPLRTSLAFPDPEEELIIMEHFEVIFFLANTDPQEITSRLVSFELRVTDVFEAQCWMGSQVTSINASKLEGFRLRTNNLKYLCELLMKQKTQLTVCMSCCFSGNRRRI